MNDVTYRLNSFQFIARVSALIFNKDMTKILLFTVKGREIYLLPGGKIRELEDSLTAIKREINEELGWNDLNYSFAGLIEGFVNDKGYNNHQFNVVYRATYNGEVTKTEFTGLEGDWIIFKWLPINEIDKYRVFPSNIKKLINEERCHFIDNLIGGQPL